MKMITINHQAKDTERGMTVKEIADFARTAGEQDPTAKGYFVHVRTTDRGTIHTLETTIAVGRH